MTAQLPYSPYLVLIIDVVGIDMGARKKNKVKSQGWTVLPVARCGGGRRMWDCDKGENR